MQAGAEFYAIAPDGSGALAVGAFGAPDSVRSRSLADAGALMSTEREFRARPELVPVARPARTGVSKPSVSSAAGLVLQLQRAAGNDAVTRALQRTRSAAAAPASMSVQLASAEGSGAPAAGPQLAAVWNTQVVVPLARAADRVGRATPDFPGAKSDLEGALRSVATLRDATPSGDPNRLRFDIIERHARGVLELVKQRLGVGRTDNQLDSDTIKIRLEATELGPKLEHRPGPDEAKFVGGGGEAADASGEAAPNAAESGGPSSAAPDTAPGPAAGADASGAGGDSVADLWNFMVVQRLWSAQKELSENPKFAIFDYSSARLNILLFLKATPEGHPNRLPLIKLESGVGVIADQMASRSTEFVSTDPLDEQAVDAWDTATAMVEFISGGPAPDASEGPAGAPAAGAKGGKTGVTQEPAFTWERGSPNKANDTDLEQP